MVKHQLTDATDLYVAYSVDKARKVIDLEIDHIDSYLLLTFLNRLGQQIDLSENEFKTYRIEVLVAGTQYTARVVTLPKAGSALERTLTLNPSESGIAVIPS